MFGPISSYISFVCWYTDGWLYIYIYIYFIYIYFYTHEDSPNSFPRFFGSPLDLISDEFFIHDFRTWTYPIRSVKSTNRTGNSAPVVSPYETIIVIILWEYFHENIRLDIFIFPFCGITMWVWPNCCGNILMRIMRIYHKMWWDHIVMG